MNDSRQRDDPRVLADVLAMGLELPLSNDASVPAADGRSLQGDQLPHMPGYRILARLGEGGMGTVYEAEQQHPRRRVALKLIRPGRMTPAMLRRFEYEADVLGRLDHPGIARVYHAGTIQTSLGRQPFFAMELVQGMRLDRWISRHDPSQRKRLELLIDICRAVHHAHTKGVIHRDLKPANILVTDEGQPKILDFGVARATDSDIQSTTLHTETGQLVGTLPYMAPEQAAGRANELDTSSDVYALGVIAYELLSGKMPYSLEGKPLHEAVRVICEDEPSRLSRIDRSLRGDVETIVGKALEKDRLRRYHTAGEFAADVKRYLDYEPITARPPGTWYQLTRFARRNKLLVGSATIVFLALAGATVVSTWQAVRATAEKHRADEQAAIARAVNDFFNSDVLGQANILGRASPPTTVRDALDRAEKRIAEQFRNQPVVEAAVRYAIGSAYMDMDDPERGRRHLEIALDINRRAFGEHHPETLKTLSRLGVTHGSTDSANLSRPGLSSGSTDSAKAEQLLEQAMRAQAKILGEAHPDTLMTMSRLAAVYVNQQRHKEAESLCSTVWSHREALLNHPRTMVVVLWNLDLVYLAFEEYEKAEAVLREGLQMLRGRHGRDSPHVLDVMGLLAGALRAAGKHAEAESVAMHNFEGCHKIYGEMAPTTLNALDWLVHVTRPSEAAKLVPVVERYLSRLHKSLGEEHPTTLYWKSRLGLLYAVSGQPDKAEPLLLEARQVQRKVLGEKDSDTLNTSGLLVWLFLQQNRYAEVEPLLLELHAHRQDISDATYRNTLRALADICDATDRPDEAAKWRAELAALQAATQPSTLPGTQPATDSLRSARR